MASVSTLYPPIIDTYMPAFVATSSACRVYFSLSKYNSINDIKSIWVTVNNQFTNESVLNTSTGLKAFNTSNLIWIDESRNGDDKYYITLNNSDIIDGWTLNQLYKVQIRFCVQECPEPITMNWIIDNENSFSEWSTVCLIQGISQPTLKLKNFNELINGNETIFTSANNYLVGKVSFEDEEELSFYQVFIYNRNELTTPIYTSGIVYTNAYNPNEINHFINYAFIDGEQYLMEFTYTTKNGFQETQSFAFSIINLGGEVFKAKITATPEDEEGRVLIRVSSDTDRFFGNLTIRRTSSATNFAIWEDVHTTTIVSEDFLDFTWYDYTVESGVWYKYCVQKRNSYGDRGLIVSIDDPVMVTLQDMFLTKADRQLKIKLNPQVNSFKHTLSESVNQTLGSKYPFIKRNGNVDYRQFSISGLISHLCDEQELFVTKEELYQGCKDLYDEYNQENKITQYNDFTLERTFREKVQEFLYSNDVKLFRSPSEGNILVRLMDVSFTPETTLGRMIYTFSATAYEIDEITFDNFEKYGIQKVGTYGEYILNSYSAIGQYSGEIRGSLKEYVQDKVAGVQVEGLTRQVKYFTDIKVEFNSKPYLIDTSSNPPKKITSSDSPNECSIMGYLLEVGNGSNTIVVGPSGYYSLSGENLKIDDISFTYSEDVIINYRYFVEEQEDTSELARQIYYSSKVGQLWGWYTPIDSITEEISNKYYRFYEGESYQRLFALNSVKIEADPNTVFYLRDSYDLSFNRFMIGETGLLNMEDNNYSIEGLYFLGTFLTEKEDEEGIEKYERTQDLEFVFRVAEGAYETVSEIKEPEKNGVYLVEKLEGININTTFSASDNDYLNKLYDFIQPSYYAEEGIYGYRAIYFQNNWYLFTKDNVVIRPIQALIDYRYELEEGEF